MGRRNYAMADYDTATGEIQFAICVEKSQGSGTTKECVLLSHWTRLPLSYALLTETARLIRYYLRAPPPRW